MNQVFHFIKIAASVVCVVAGSVCLFVALPLALPLFVGAIAWAQVPE